MELLCSAVTVKMCGYLFLQFIAPAFRILSLIYWKSPHSLTLFFFFNEFVILYCRFLCCTQRGTSICAHLRARRTSRTSNLNHYLYVKSLVIIFTEWIWNFLLNVQDILTPKSLRSSLTGQHCCQFKTAYTKGKKMGRKGAHFPQIPV